MNNVYYIDKTLSRTSRVTKKTRYIILTAFAFSLILFGLVMDSPKNILPGIQRIIVEPDILITDYISVGGIGAAFVNSGLTTLAFLIILYRLRLELYGTAITALFLISGFSFFGKNIFNIWFIVLGVYLYARFQRESFTRYIYTALFGTALAPLVTELMFNIPQPLSIRLPLAIINGLAMGFVLPPMATFALRVHQGYNLYNIGFTAGLVGTAFMSTFRSLGLAAGTRMVWSTEYTSILSVFLFTIFLSIIITGYILNGKSFKGIPSIMKYSGRMVTDFVQIIGFAPSLINMGVCGIISTLFVLLVKGDINGPVLAGIFSVVGFATFGKHPKNIVPIFLGIFVGSMISIWRINDPNILLAALFGTTLAPIAGEYGWKVGMIAGFLHSSVVLNISTLHGGINLYNNGFSGGLVAAFLVPIIDAFRRKDEVE